MASKDELTFPASAGNRSSPAQKSSSAAIGASEERPSLNTLICVTEYISQPRSNCSTESFIALFQIRTYLILNKILISLGFMPLSGRFDRDRRDAVGSLGELAIK